MGALIPSQGDQQGVSIEEADGVQQQEMKLLRLGQDVVQLEGKLQEMTTENEALRKGMHEILDSIHNQDGTVLILTPCSKILHLYCLTFIVWE